MSDVVLPSDVLQKEFRLSLRYAKKRIYWASVKLALQKGCRRGSIVALSGAVLATILFASAYFFQIHIISWLPPVLTGIATIIAIIISMIPALFVRPTLRQVAERLDLGTQGENRIASALDFIQQDSSKLTPFMYAAIVDGQDALSQNQRKYPVVPKGTWYIRALILKVIFTLALFTITLMPMHFSLSPQYESVEKIGAVPVFTDIPVKTTAESKVPVNHEKKVRVGTEQDGCYQSSALSIVETHAQQPVLIGSGTNISGASRLSSKEGASSSAGVATGRSHDQTELTQPLAGNQHNRNNQNNVPSNSGRQEGETSANLARLGSARSGGGAAHAVTSPARMLQSHVDTDAKNMGGVIVPPEKTTDSQNQGSQQPLLQDRRQAPARELSISSGKSGGGNGRGGPTPAKKSRGTGALLFSVPIPDYIPAPLRPGLSRVQYEASSPTPMSNRTHSFVDAALRRTDENPQILFDPGADHAQTAWRYFEDIHRQDHSRDQAGPINHVEQRREPNN